MIWHERDGGRCGALDIRLFLHLLPDSGSRIRWTLRAGDGDERDRKEVEMNVKEKLTSLILISHKLEQRKEGKCE